MKRFFCLFICLIQIVILFCGCAGADYGAESVPFKTKASVVPSGVVAENGDYKLEWDSGRCSLAILKKDSVIWASMPIDQYLNNSNTGTVKKYIESHIIVDYKDETTNTITNVTSYIGAFEDGRVYSYLVNDGIRILYCFDKQCFAIPVIYQLRDGYLDITLENKNIYESGNEIYQVSILPYSCSADNTAKSRIFVPDGSGMIMKCDTKRNTRDYSARVFGNDGAEPESYKFIYNENVHLPVFASGNPDSGTYCSIISDGASAASINASAGNSTIGYSYVYASFRVRGSETVQIPQGWGQVSITGQYSDIARAIKMKMRIAFIDDFDSAFNNVAKYYRDYLIDQKGLEKKNHEKMLYIDMPMALSQRKFFFGLPYDVTKSITTYKQCLSILNDISENTGESALVRLSGIQKGGLEVSQVAGGFSTEKTLGSSEEWEELLKASKKLGVEIFPDFDITRYRQSSGGFSIRSDSIRSASSMSSTQYFYSLSTGAELENAYRYYLLTPAKFYSAAEKLLKKINEMGVGNISLNSLGNRVYSDFDYQLGYLGGDYINQFNKTNKLFKSNGIKAMYDSANEYSAVCADYIINAPTNTSRYDFEDEWIPFYEMVFKGYIPMSCQSINLSDISRKELLKAIQCGLGLSFTVCGDETLDYSTSKFPQLLAGSYENSKETILEFVEEAKDVIKLQYSADIKSFKTLSKGVCQTEFSNGNTVIVNYTDEDYTYAEDQIVKSMDYKLLKDGE